jgi:hypothetical protein
MCRVMVEVEAGYRSLLQPGSPIVASDHRPVLDKPRLVEQHQTGDQAPERGVATRTQVNPVTPNDPGGRRQVAVRCSNKSRPEVEKVIQKLAFKDKEAGETIQPKVRISQEGLEAEFVQNPKRMPGLDPTD